MFPPNVGPIAGLLAKLVVVVVVVEEEKDHFSRITVT